MAVHFNSKRTDTYIVTRWDDRNQRLDAWLAEVRVTGDEGSGEVAEAWYTRNPEDTQEVAVTHTSSFTLAAQARSAGLRTTIYSRRDRRIGRSGTVDLAEAREAYRRWLEPAVKRYNEAQAATA